MRLLQLLPLGLATIAAATELPPLATILQHQIHALVDPTTGHVEVHDRLRLSGQHTALMVGAEMTVLGVEQQGREVAFSSEALEQGRLIRWMVTCDELVIHAEGNFAPPSEGAAVEREAEAMEINARISTRGAYLSPAAGWYASGEESLTRFDLSVTLPGGWLAVSEGHVRLEETVSGTTSGGDTLSSAITIHHHASFPVDGVHLCAGPYERLQRQAGETLVETYFFAEDAALAPTYLDASADYLARYEQLFGPYPFKRFAVVENFMPTGYGMPTFTLLGQRVVRLPFIVKTSLGHEVLHNWWGNSVYVDYDSGNWCEGLTSYGADYAYKVEESPAAARRYRKDLLKAYADYVAEGADLPLAEFTGRTDMATRAIGYGKAAMVFHMARTRMGAEAFDRSLHWMARAYRWRHVSWTDFFSTFAEVSGQDFVSFEAEWVERAGAPKIELGTTRVSEAASGFRLELELRQSEPFYELDLPVRVRTEGGVREELVRLEGAATTLQLQFAARPLRVEIDPGYDVFRHLDADEREATLSEFFGVPQRNTLVTAELQEGEGAKSLAAALAQDGAATAKGPVALARISSTLPAAIQLPPESRFDPSGKLVLGEHQFDPATEAAVLALRGARGPELHIITGDSTQLPPLGRKLHHYGRYSYLVFRSGSNVAKGNWSVAGGPLSRDL